MLTRMHTKSFSYFSIESILEASSFVPRGLTSLEHTVIVHVYIESVVVQTSGWCRSQMQRDGSPPLGDGRHRSAGLACRACRSCCDCAHCCQETLTLYSFLHPISHITQASFFFCCCVNCCTITHWLDGMA